MSSSTRLYTYRLLTRARPFEYPLKFVLRFILPVYFFLTCLLIFVPALNKLYTAAILRLFDLKTNRII